MMKALHPKAGSRKVHEIWHKLFCELDRLSKLQVIVCPDSTIHYEESLVYQLGEQVKRIYELFSHGITFRDVDFVWGRQTLESFESWIETGRPPQRYNAERAISGDPNRWQDKIIITTNLPTSPERQEYTKVRKQEIHQRMLGLYKAWSKERNDFSHWFGQELAEVKDQTIDKFGNQLVQATRIRYPDINAVETVTGYFGNDLSEHLPLPRIQAALFAQTAHDVSVGGRLRPKDEGDYNDIQALSFALPYCDAVLVDNASRSLVNRVRERAGLQFPSQIFGIDQAEAFLEFLEKIESQIPKEHLKMVAEVYGPDYGLPYVEVFHDDQSLEQK